MLAVLSQGGELGAHTAAASCHKIPKRGLLRFNSDRPITGDDAKSDAIYNSTPGLWQCCGTDSKGNANCEDPVQDKFFSAPSPQDLVSTYAITATSSEVPVWELSSIPVTQAETTAPDGTTSASALPTATTATTDAQASSRGRSTVAQTGIGILGGLCGILIAGEVVHFLLRRRQNKRRPAADLSEISPMHNMSPEFEGGQLSSNRRAPVAELDYRRTLVEMPLAQNSLQELRGDGDSDATRMPLAELDHGQNSILEPKLPQDFKKAENW